MTRGPAVKRSLLAATLLAVVPGLAAPRPPGAEVSPALRPLLVTVDDLPVAGRGGGADAAERSRITEALLGHLRAHRIPAVGFVIWKNVRDDAGRALLERWLAEGHELGSHSFSHLNFTATDVDTYRADAERARSEIEGFLAPRGRHLRLFRFPYLREGDTPEKVAAMRGYLKETGQRNVPVTIDNQDWSFDNPWRDARLAGEEAQADSVAEDYHAALRLAVRHHEARGDRLLGRATPQVLLLHANAIGAAEWGRLFEWLEQTGHRFATADEVLAEPTLADPPAVVTPYGYGAWDRLWQVQGESTARDEAAALLARQVEAWNAGNLSAFCSVYAEDATYVSPSGMTRGRPAILDQYARRYPDRAAMGTLGLEVLEARPVNGVEFSLLGDAVPGRVHSVSVVARWRLDYPGREPAEGKTLIVLRRAGDEWRIVQDASF
jgi:peptidoglycan/xylan/chitin deacetylase (PgdA/CDA1 family)/ketosteroid isomerase-like protein